LAKRKANAIIASREKKEIGKERKGKEPFGHLFVFLPWEKSVLAERKQTPIG